MPCVVIGRLRTLLRIDEAAHVPVVEISLLRTTPVFRALPGPAMEGVANALRRVEHNRGALILRQGDEGHHYDAIADGVVEIRQDGRPIATLTRGEGMGDVALLRAGVRTASAVALTPVTLYEVGRDAFFTALTGHPPTERAAGAVVRGLQEGTDAVPRHDRTPTTSRAKRLDEEAVLPWLPTMTRWRCHPRRCAGSAMRPSSLGRPAHQDA